MTVYSHEAGSMTWKAQRPGIWTLVDEERVKMSCLIILEIPSIAS